MPDPTHPPGSAPVEPTPQSPAGLAASRLVDALDTAATVLERLAREQDALAVALDHDTLTPEHAEQGRAAIATTRGEAARAMVALLPILPGGADGEPTVILRALRSGEALSSEKLRADSAWLRALAGAAS